MPEVTQLERVKTESKQAFSLQTPFALLFLFAFSLEESSFTLLCPSLLHGKVTRPCAHTSPPPLDFLPISVATEPGRSAGAGAHYLSVSHMAVCARDSQPPCSSRPCLPALVSVRWLSQCLCLYFCFLNKIIYTIFRPSLVAQM